MRSNTSGFTFPVSLFPIDIAGSVRYNPYGDTASLVIVFSEALIKSRHLVKLFFAVSLPEKQKCSGAAAQGLLTNNGTAEWWLRPSWDRYCGGSHDVYVGVDGGVRYPVTDEPQYFVGLGIRPVMWINVRAYEEICNME